MIPTERERDKVPPRRFSKDDFRFAVGRITFLQYVIVAAFLLLVANFWDLQVRNPELYSERARQNRIKAIPILAPRGKILDRDGRVLVDNVASYSLILSRENLRPEQLRNVASGLDLDYDALVARVQRFDKTRPKYEPIVIKEELTPGEVAFVEAHRDEDGFPEMELIEAHRRLYPGGGLAAHLTGYVGEVSEAELNTLEFVQYRQGDVIGKAGIERRYNNLLMGVDGQRRVVVDNRGRERQLIGISEAVPGRDLRLSIDLDLQVVADLAMEDRRGAVVALDPQSGEVLAMVSRPAYDPNKFAGRILASDWQEIVNDPETPMLNRAIQAQLAPGSTFKPIVALAALETGAIAPSYNVYCRGAGNFYGDVRRCHQRGGHGLVDFYHALVESCDIYYYNLGDRLGIDRIAHYAEMAGFGRRTGIDLPGEEPGLVPSTEWKMRTFRQKWYPGETISVAIGQGALTVTPLQLAYAIGGMAMGGVWYAPHLALDLDRDAGQPRRARFSSQHAALIFEGMYGVVNDGGTGIRASIPGVEVCGKTGTAQLVSTAAQAASSSDRFRDNAWFIGFAPRQNPEIVVAVLFEAGEHGNLAAPIARDVLKAYFDKKARRSGGRLLLTDARPSAASPDRPASVE